MPPDPLSIAAGISSGASGIAGSIASIINTNKTIQANKAMAEYAYNKDLEMWNRQNAYNAPIAQMARYKEGGLNPNLIYGQGSPGNATSLPHYQAPKQEYNYQAPNLAQGIQTYANLTQQKALIDNVKMRTDETEQDIINKKIDEVRKGIEAKIDYEKLTQAGQKTKWYEPLLEQQYRKGESSIKYQGSLQAKAEADRAQSVARTRLIGYQGDVAKTYADKYQDVLNLNLANLRARLLKTNADIALTHGNIGLLNSKEQLMQSQIGLTRQNESTSFANELLAKAREKLVNKQISWYVYQQILAGIDRMLSRRGQNMNFLGKFIPSTNMGKGGNFGQLIQ